MYQLLVTWRSTLEKLATADHLEIVSPLCQDRGCICLTQVLQCPSKEQVSSGGSVGRQHVILEYLSMRSANT